MREYGKVYTAFWTSPDTRALSEDGRTLALYLLTCPHGNMLGCFRLTDAYAADDMQWKPERVRKGFDELFAKGFAYRCERTFYVLIRYYLKWNQFENPNVGTAAGKMFDSLGAPATVKGALALALREFAPRFPPAILAKYESVSEPFTNPFETNPETRARARAKPEPEPQPQPEPQPEQTLVGQKPDVDPIEGVFGYWQKIMGSPKSVLDDKRRKLIVGALKLYSPAQLCQAIRGCKKSDFHMARGKYAGNNKQNGLNLILRDAEHIDKFIAIDGEAAASTGSGETIDQQNERILREMGMSPDGAPAGGDVIDMVGTSA